MQSAWGGMLHQNKSLFYKFMIPHFRKRFGLMAELITPSHGSTLSRALRGRWTSKQRAAINCLYRNKQVGVP